jgi:protein-L-isoaspartate(D-aspartate) O-methyltransferase
MITFPGLPPVDRRLFIPETVYVWERAGDGREWMVPLRRRDDPVRWEALVAEDKAVTTQTDANDPQISGVEYPLGKGFFPTSSASAPWVVRQMLDALKVEPGMRVLEIGTGTGFNAACLAAMGTEVVSVEIDLELADQARDALRAAGFSEVMVIPGDGEYGVPAAAPYDRVIATAAAHSIPYPWVEQTRDGGLIVAPYTGEGHKGGMLVLTVHDGTAVGGIEGDAAFMPLRGQKLQQPELNAIETRSGLRLEVTAEGQRLITV